MRFLVNSTDIACVELHQVNEDEVQIWLDGEPVAYFDSDENEFVVYQDTLKNKFNVTVSVEDQQV
jgi:urate oxidase